MATVEEEYDEWVGGRDPWSEARDVSVATPNYADPTLDPFAPTFEPDTRPNAQAQPYVNEGPGYQREERSRFGRSSHWAPGMPETYTGNAAEREGNPPRFTLDNPPWWDGKNPEQQAEPFLKLLTAWLTTTRTLQRQQGVLILQAVTGDLKVLVNELDLDALTSENGGQRVFDLIRAAYKEYVEQPLPKHLEAALFQSSGQRQKGEPLLTYTSRKSVLFRQLERAKCNLPDEAKGYILLRDAKLSSNAWDVMTTWTKGSYDFETIKAAMRKLERPVPGHGGNVVSSLTALVESEPSTSEFMCGLCGSGTCDQFPAAEEDHLEK